jgi:hypothetical protein
MQKFNEEHGFKEMPVYEEAKPQEEYYTEPSLICREGLDNPV